MTPRVGAGGGVFATMLVAALLLAGASALGYFAASGAMSFIPSLNLRDPALARVAPDLDTTPRRRLARRVVLVLIDGLRLDASYGRPFLDRLRQRGIDAEAQTHFPSLSLPNYVSTVTGVEPRWSGVRTNDYAWPVPVDSVMARARAAGMRVAFLAHGDAGFVNLFAAQLDEAVDAPWPDGIMRDAARRLLSDEARPELVLLWFIDVDTAGHQFGAASPEYRDAARSVDEILGTLLAGLDLARDTVVVTADHGHLDRGGHGGLEQAVTSVPLVMAGAGVRPGAVLLGTHLTDVAPTVAALLGLPAPGHSLGRTLTAALALTPDEASSLIRADDERIQRLQPLVANAERAAEPLADAASRRHAALLVALLALLVALIALLARRRLIHVDRRVLLIGIPAFPVIFYGVTVMLEPWLSPSMLPSRGHVAGRLFLYGAIAGAGNLVAVWLALRGRRVPRDRLAAACGIVLIGLSIAIAPAGAAWALAADRSLAVALPGPGTLVLSVMTYTAVAFYALSAAGALALEYIIFWARASDPSRRAGGGEGPP